MPSRNPLPSPFAALLAGASVKQDDIALDGTQTRIWTYGPHDAPCLVLLHGYRGDHHGLEPITGHLPGLRVVLPDLPGFGASARLAHGKHDIAGYAAWTHALLRHVAPEGSAVLAGHSFGSIVASAALAAPDAPAVRGLVLVNPIARSALLGKHRAATRATVLAHRLAGVLPEQIGTSALRHPWVSKVAGSVMATTSDRALRRWIDEEHDRYFSTFADRSTLLEAFGASVTADVASSAPRVTVPTLLVAGERDDLAPPAGQRALLGLFPDARLSILAGVGHLTHYEAPDRVAAQIDRFVQGLPR
jgi:pimeloyl-ACP methyl ester carboxylesterase